MPGGDSLFRRSVDKCASGVHLCDQSTISKLLRSFLSSKQSIVKTRGERDSERRVCASKYRRYLLLLTDLLPVPAIGYYLGRKSK